MLKRLPRFFRAGMTCVIVVMRYAYGDMRSQSRKQLIAHRGASAYAPEHTLAAYRLALEQGADYVEQDLAVTKDGTLICLHDESLERTTNVEAVFPDRFTIDVRSGARRWLAADFTLAQIRMLDAGSWFDPRFRAERVPTWQEAVALVGTRAGLYPELKAPQFYRGRGVDVASLFVASLRQLGLISADGTPIRRLVVQSFDDQVLRDLSRRLPRIPRTFLIEVGDEQRWLSSRAALAEIASFATGIGPAKVLLESQPQIVQMAHDTGLTVAPYTFRSSATGRFHDVGSEMRHFLFELGVDALFTDNPDLFPGQP